MHFNSIHNSPQDYFPEATRGLSAAAIEPSCGRYTYEAPRAEAFRDSHGQVGIPWYEFNLMMCVIINVILRIATLDNITDASYPLTSSDLWLFDPLTSIGSDHLLMDL